MRHTAAVGSRYVKQKFVAGSAWFSAQLHDPALSPQVANAYCGGYHTFLTVQDSGDVYATGLNNYGQLGIGDAEPRYEPTLVHTLKGVNVVSISVRRTRRRELASRMWLVVFCVFSRRRFCLFCCGFVTGRLAQQRGIDRRRARLCVGSWRQWATGHHQGQSTRWRMLVR